MITHCIIMSSSYTLGTRIALDYVIYGEDMQERLRSESKQIIKECGRDVSISTHMIQAENEEWSSVCRADHFFKDVKVVTNVHEFIDLIKQDRNLQGIDIAKYILSKFSCTQLKLQKLVYLCFADYLCSTGKELFTDKIYAYKYGPVIDTVYKKYKEYGYKPIEKEKGDINSSVSEMPAKSRILFAESGLEKIQSIDTTLKKYASLSANELVTLTHKENSPWSKTPKRLWPVVSEIEKDTIIKYHKYEVIRRYNN